MELIINFGIYLLLSILIGYVLTMIIISIIRVNKKVHNNEDVNIEWYGPSIYLKDKIYDNEFEISDRNYYKSKEEKRIANVKKRNNGSNSESITSTRD